MKTLEIVAVLFLTGFAFLLYKTFLQLEIILKLTQSLLEKHGAPPADNKPEVVSEDTFRKDAHELVGDEREIKEFQEITIEKGKAKLKDKQDTEV